ncbi:Ran-binding protein 10 [Penicillium subrubescens]|uniref:Protein FYV10 n=1 Tax=Penicillium subrubescens TaxID=1316194 RepID=A0A1Q5ULF3_9EURO|nr:Ran-binding protein 10 [Penicillium subrubescens]
MTDLPFPGGASRAPTYGISSGPRRSSYASVVSGTAFSPPTPITSSFPHIFNTNPVSSYPPSQPDGRLPRALSGLDAADMHLNSAWRTSGSPDSLPAYSRKYAGYLRPSEFPHGLGLLDGPSFFTPSYLRDSHYISRLDAAHRAKLAAQQRDVSSSTSASGPALSASSSHVHLPRLAPSHHRGVAYEVSEKEPPAVTSDQVSPLPTQWSSSDKYAGLELSNDGLDVRYTGPVHKHDHEAAALRADHPMPPQCGIYYFEIKIESKPKEGMIGIGFSSPKASVERLPGWEQESWAYHGDDGKSFFGESQGQGRPYGPTFGVGDTAERASIQSEINATSTDSLQPPLNESALLQELVAQFLAHDGYVETARAFAEEVATETAALQSGQREPLKKYEVEEDREAINRNKIRAAILDGDIDKALKHTKAYYANVLESNPQIHFKLRCRKFLEMMRRSTELTPGTSSNPKRRRPDSPGLGIADEHAVFDQEMELDDGTWDGGDGMDTEDQEPTSAAPFNEVLTEAVQYGQQLCMDYPSDENGGDRKMLEDIFSLVAYPDPLNSVHGHYLDPAGRVAVAEELNSAILEALVNEISEDGGAGAFINVRNDVLL